MQANPTYVSPRTPSRYTDGPIVGEQIARWLGRRPTPTQQLELDLGLERIDGPGSPFAFDTVIVIKGRRCGKTVTTMGVPLVRALAGPVTLPNRRVMPFRAVHIAQNLTQARQRFGEDLVDAYRTRFDDVTWKRAAEHRRGAADTVLLVDPRRRKDLEDAKKRRLASELRVLAPTPSSARGAGVLHRTYDEALTFTLERGDMLENAGRPTMAEMHGLAQTWWVSNISTDTDARMKLWHLRQKGRAAVLEGRTEGIAYVEYSLPPGEDPDDEANWWRYYPALGDGIVGIRELRRDREELADERGPTAFAAEYLGRWADENPTGQVGWEVIDADAWMTERTDVELPVDAPAGLGVQIDPFGRTSTISAAVEDPDNPGGVILEPLADGPGSEWVEAELLRYVEGAASIAINDHGAGRALLERLQGMPLVADRLVPVRSADFATACYEYEARVRDRRHRWRANEHEQAYTRAAAAATRAGGQAWYWEQRGTTPVSPIVAGTLALWALEHRPVPLPDPEIF